MTVEEIFSDLSKHMIEGLMAHSQLSDYFGFLGLEGYQIAHKYHYFEENNNYRRLSEYYLSHYNKIIPEKKTDNPALIPESWYQYTRQDVNASTRKSSIQAGFEKWIEWEKSTKELYGKYCYELISLKEIAAAEELKYYLMDVNKELSNAQQKYLILVADNYNISDILDEQKELSKTYKEKLKKIL